MDNGAAHLGTTPHAFTRGGRGRGGGGGGQGGGGQGGGGDSESGKPAPPGCLFGGWRSVVIDDERAAERQPVQGVAALGLLLVVVCLLVFWFIAR
jgi:hypothetical protein